MTSENPNLVTPDFFKTINLTFSVNVHDFLVAIFTSKFVSLKLK